MDVWVTCRDRKTAAMYGDSETLFSCNNLPRHPNRNRSSLFVYVSSSLPFFLTFSLCFFLSFPPYHLTFYVGVLISILINSSLFLLWLTIFYYLAQILPDISVIVLPGSTEFLNLCDMPPSFLQCIFLHQHFISNRF